MAESNISAARLREILSYCQETGVFMWKIRKRGIVPGKRAGSLSLVLGYRIICIDKTHFYEHRLAWLYVYGEWPAQQVDHINCFRADNRIANLRLATSGQNKQNKKDKNGWSATGVRGVYFARTPGKFRAAIGFGGKNITLGQFDTIEEATKARRAAEERYFTHV